MPSRAADTGAPGSIRKELLPGTGTGVTAGIAPRPARITAQKGNFVPFAAPNATYRRGMRAALDNRQSKQTITQGSSKTMSKTIPASHKSSAGLPTATPAMQNECVFHFPEGLPAFEEVKEYVLLCKPETTPFLFMRATKPANLGFVCIDPFLIHLEYKPRISDADTAALEITGSDEILILSIVTASPDVHKTTANLQAPLVINLRTGKGKQIICDRQEYPVRYAIWDALDALSEKPATRSTPAEPNRSAA
jgi:flagellar assembly factor FliW